MSSDRSKKAGDHLNSFMDAIYKDLENTAGSAVKVFKDQVVVIDERFGFVEGQIEALRKDVGSIKNDVARGDGSLKTFTIPRKKGTWSLKTFTADPAVFSKSL